MPPHRASPSAIDVLIAEDDPDIRASLRFALRHAGYTCAEADNGADAVAMTRFRPPRLLLLDLMMPALDGLAVARQVHADPRTAAVPICCLTARADAVARREAARAGCTVFLTKPAPTEVILDSVALALAGRP